MPGSEGKRRLRGLEGARAQWGQQGTAGTPGQEPGQERGPALPSRHLGILLGGTRCSPKSCEQIPVTKGLRCG